MKHNIIENSIRIFFDVRKNEIIKIDFFHLKGSRKTFIVLIPI